MEASCLHLWTSQIISDKLHCGLQHFVFEDCPAGKPGEGTLAVRTSLEKSPETSI